jgi:hypothetical protein
MRQTTTRLALLGFVCILLSIHALGFNLAYLISTGTSAVGELAGETAEAQIAQDSQESELSSTAMLDNPPCPTVFDPVCGSDGVTYINSCYAEQAGVFDYTPGLCYGSCIDPDLIDPDADCGGDFQPVCGCNGVTYLNACAAEAAGVTSYTPGSCNTSCYDPSTIPNSLGVQIDYDNGIVSVSCPQTAAPVCGCDGVTYLNACHAMANGVTAFTPGQCGDGCVDPGQINPDNDCPSEYNPVCGCNNVTYFNECAATAAGILSTMPGVCGGNSSWCGGPVQIQCGDFLPLETTVGAGNQINFYPSCTGNISFSGPDKVYAIHKTKQGDLQIGLEIITPNLDLDIFLLAPNCNSVTCLGASITSNNLTNNEGIVLEDAPPGLYYLVVDGQFLDSQGEYRLEVSCGYLDCSDAQPVYCGEPFSYTNLYGDDNVSLYGCDGNIYNVENNGPEVVHYFTIIEPDTVQISLTGLSANLELFLLRSCDRGECMLFSQNPGSNDEFITAYLEAGTYYVVVDGYNGAVSNYTLLVECSAPCDMELLDLVAAPTPCGQSNGSITIISANGEPDYIVHYDGPVSGSVVSDADTTVITELPTGIYTVRKTDARGCTVEGIVTINSISNISMTLDVTNAECSTPGSIRIIVANGAPPFFAQIAGPVNSSQTGPSPIIDFNDLPAGDYVVFLRDGLGCTTSQQVTINLDNNGLDFSTGSSPAGCQESGVIQIFGIVNGAPPYSVSYAGPSGGSLTSSEETITIPDLPGGTYLVTLTDGNGCVETHVVEVEDNRVLIDAAANSETCGVPGSVLVSISSGTPPFLVTWTGPSPGSAVTSDNTFLITGLNSGSYSIVVTDDDQCTDVEVAFLDNGINDLTIDVVPLIGLCDDPGSIDISISGGTPDYIITWEGPVSGTDTISGPGYQITGLPSGSYEIEVKDFFGCFDIQVLELNNQADDLTLTGTAVNGICGLPGAINLSISGGTPTYTVSWSGPVSGSVQVNGPTFTIPSLAAGAYNVSITDPNGCEDFITVSVTIQPNTLNITATPVNGVCGQPGSVFVTVSGGTPDYLVTWTGPTSGSSSTAGNYILNTPLPGVYVITVSDINGCSDTETVSISISPDNLTLTATANNGFCGQSGSISLSISGGNAPYTVSWSGPPSGSQTINGTTFTIPGLPSGLYAVEVTDPQGCSDSQIVSVTTSPDDLVFTPTVTNGLCGNPGSVNLAISGGTPPFTIVWSGPSVGSATVSQNNYTISGLQSGTYSIQITDPNGCSDQKPATVSNSPNNLSFLVFTTNGLCGNLGSMTLSISGGTAPYSISWSGPSSGSAQSGSGSFQIQLLPSGNYTVVVTDPNGCSATKTATINNQADNLVLTATPVNGLCGQPGAVNLTISGGTAPYTLSWTGPSSGGVTIGTTSLQVPNLGAGTYTFNIIDPNGCNDVKTATVVVNPDNLVLTANPVDGVCGIPGSVNVAFTGGNPPYSLSWSGPVSGTATVNGSTFSINNLPQGNYTLTVNDPNGCNDVQTASVVVSPNDLSFAATITNGVCGRQGTIDLAISGGSPDYMVAWDGPANGSATVSGASYSIPDLPSGNYTVNVFDPNGCNATQSLTVSNSPDNLTLTATPVNGLCGNPGSIQLGISGGTPAYTISWSGPSAGSATTNGSSYTISDLAAGTYQVFIVDPNGCEDAKTVSVAVSQNNLTFTANAINGLCGQPGSIALAISGGSPVYSISWSGPSNGSVSTGANNFTITGLQSGQYSISVTDPNGCADTGTATVNNQPNTLDIALTPVNGLCGAPGQIAVQITGGSPNYTVSWSGPASGTAVVASGSHTIQGLPSGTYNVSVTDPNGCNDAGQAAINNSPNDLSFTIATVAGLCGQPGSINLSISGGTPAYAITWSGPSSGSAITTAGAYTISGLTDGTYNISVFDPNGCGGSQTAPLVNNPDDLTFSAVVADALCLQPGAITLSISGGSPIYTVNWTGPSTGSVETVQNTFLIDDLAAGTYQVTVSDPNGCSDFQSITVSNSPGDLDFTAAAQNGLCGQPGAIEVNITGGAPAYEIEWSGPVSGSTTLTGGSFLISDLPGGQYSLTVKDDNGCSDTDTVQLDNDANALSVAAVANDGQCGEQGEIALEFSGGSPVYSISWEGPASGAATTGGNAYTITGLDGGEYSITVTDPNGCSDSIQAVTLNTFPDDLKLTADPQNGLCGQPGAIEISVTGGSPDYTVFWNGPVSGSASFSGNSYTISNLPDGVYSLTLEDPNGCDDAKTVTIDNGSEVAVSLAGVSASCTESGAVEVSISGGSPEFQISWSGTASGSATTAGNAFEISGLEAGNYSVTVTDLNGCTDESSVVVNLEDDLSATFTATDGFCGEMGFITVEIASGAPEFTLDWQGVSTGSATFSGNTYTLPDLETGNYSLTLTDDSGCSESQTVSISNLGNVLGLAASGNSGALRPTWNYLFGNYRRRAPVFCQLERAELRIDQY